VPRIAANCPPLGRNVRQLARFDELPKLKTCCSLSQSHTFATLAASYYPTQRPSGLKTVA